jgi:diguanylate cyclase
MVALSMDHGHGGSTGGLGLLGQLFARRPAREAGPALPPLDPIADAALLALQQRRIAATPEAYTLWYKHLAGERPDLTRRLKELEASGATFDPPLVAELFERYVAADPQVLGICEASRNLERLLAALASDLELVETDARQRGDRLADLGASLGAHAPAEDGAEHLAQHQTSWRRLVGDILKETEAMRAAAARLESRVVEHAGEIAQLRARLEAAGGDADIDPVSGVATPKALHRALARAIRDIDRPLEIEPAAQPPKLCCLVVDIDGLGAFNRAHGRKLGDLALQATARHLDMAVKRGDAVGRLDGGTFGIVLVRTDLAAGEALAEQLCRLIASRRIEVADDDRADDPRLAPVTVSIGVAGYRRGEPGQRLLGRAQRACDLASEAGGNRAVSERAAAVVGRPKA